MILSFAAGAKTLILSLGVYAVDLLWLRVANY